MTNYSKTSHLPWYKNTTKIEIVELPKKITSIESCAFRDCKNLKTIKIPESVTSIGS